MKKIKILSLCLLLLVTLSTNFNIAANEEDDFENNTDYYRSLCVKPDDQLTPDQKNTCVAFTRYMANKSNDLNDRLNEIEEKREQIAKDILTYTKKIQNYDQDIAVLAKEIGKINAEIAAKQVEIDQMENDIQVMEDKVAVLEERVRQRMVDAQPTMRLNTFIDFIMGAKNFTDFIRRTNGINAITDSDDEAREQLATTIVELNKTKEELVTAQAELEKSKAEIVKKQDDIYVMKKEAEIIKQEYLKVEADLEAEGNQIAGNLQGIKDMLADIKIKIDDLPESSGFMRPISGGWITANTWAYPSGGTHLGTDYAKGSGATIRAAGNGVIIKSVDGCGRGYLGNWCGSDQGGTAGGGNQIIMLTRIDNKLYAVKYLHLLLGSPIAEGTIVNQGDKIGEMGSSGNSSGTHCHVEVYYLGTQSINDFIKNWNGNLSFDCGWGTSALQNICSKKGAPCRMRPESVFE